jgi:hypothetical protein
MGGGNTQMDESKSGLGGLTDKLLGPDYNYSKQIKPPSELGMSAEGNFDVLANDIGGLIAYVNVLVTGKGKASRTGEPLGTKFFLPTSMNCTDVATGNDVTRSIYVNNIPDGTIPFISEGMGGGFDDFRGLLPGVMSNLAQINPLQILQAFVNGPSPNCQAITMETVDVNNVHNKSTGYVTNTDIDVMNPSWFVVPGFTSKPDTSKKPPEKSESFTTMHANSTLLGPKTLKGSRIDYGAMPKDFFIKIYLSSLGLLGLYFFMKMAMKRRLK